MTKTPWTTNDFIIGIVNSTSTEYVNYVPYKNRGLSKSEIHAYLCGKDVSEDDVFERNPLNPFLEEKFEDELYE